LTKEKYKENIISPEDIKLGVTDFLILFLEPIRNYFINDNMTELLSKAYPKI
jgi:hypothetical protein